MSTSVIFSERCYVCGAFLEKGSHFCGLCGNSLSRDTLCPECGTQIADVYSFCNFCGCSLNKPLHEEPKHYPMERRTDPREKKRSEITESPVDQKKSVTPEKKTEQEESGKSSFREERRLVTILFADVSGFTSMSEKLDAEEVKDTMSSLFDILSKIIVAEGGTIDKYIGDCIMALFGAPVSHGDDPIRAVRAAIKMQRALDRFALENKDHLGVTLKMRIGINSGFVLAGYVGGEGKQEYTVMGDTVNLASRMESSGVPGKIQISEYTRNLIGDKFILQQVGEITVKGKVEPVKAFFVLNETHSEADSGTISFMGRDINFVAREKESEMLEKMMSEVFEEGISRLVVIEGKRGIGKTSLIERFLSGVAPAFVFHGRALKSNSSEPFAPVIKAIRSFFQNINENEKTGLFSFIFGEKIASEEIEQFPQELFRNLLSGDEIALDYENDKNAFSLRNYMKTLFFSVLSRVSKKRPVVFLISDAHFMDSATKEFLEFVINQKQESNRIFLIAEIQSNPDRPGPVFKYDQRIEHLQINEFSQDEQLVLIKEILHTGKSVPEWITEWIFTNFSGNPLYITEFVRSLISLKIITEHPETGEWIVPEKKPVNIVLPPTIHNAMQASIDILSNEEKNILQIAAAVGYNFWDSVVLSILKESEKSNVYQLIESLRAKGIVKRRFSSLIPDSVEYRFANETLHKVAYDIIPRKYVTKMNLACAEILIERGLDRTHPIMIAQHLESGCNIAEAVNYYLLGAQTLYDRYSLQEAGQIIEHVRTLLPEKDENIDTPYATLSKIHLLRAQLMRSFGKYDEASVELDLAESIIPEKPGKNDNQTEWMTQKFKMLKLQGLLAELQGRFEEALENYEKAIEVIGDKDLDPALMHDIRASRNGILIKLKQIEKAEKDSIELTRDILIESVESPQLANAFARHFDNLAQVFQRRSDPAGAELVAYKSLELRKKGGNPRLIGICENNIAAVQTMQNKWTDAAEAFLNGLKQRELYGDPFDIAVSCLNLSESYHILKKPEQARHYFEKGKEVVTQYKIGLTEELNELEKLINSK